MILNLIFTLNQRERERISKKSSYILYALI